VTSPGAPAPNPKLIIVETSVLLQTIGTDSLTVFRRIRTEFGIQAVIVQAVESEAFYHLENVAKFRGRQEQLRKALGNGTLATVDHNLLAPLFGSGADSWLRQIESEGERFYSIVDRGEAFSHAASSVLSAPIATNDTSAVYRLIRGKENVPRPIIRFWDLIVLCYQIDMLTEGDCDRIRQALERIGERLPACFTRRSFRDGLPNFYSRLTDIDRPVVGATEQQERLDERLMLRRLPAPNCELDVPNVP
jgi:hypothetical protein